MNKYFLATAASVALTLAGCSGSAKDSASQTASAAAAAATDAGGSDSGASASLEGVKGRIPLYDSNVTRKPGNVISGMYDFETSDPPAQVAAWYKAHVPAALAGKWSDPDPDAAPEWVYQAKLSDGAVNVTIQPVVAANQAAYAPGTKSIVAVIDR
jgi:hypothetical protein